MSDQAETLVEELVQKLRVEGAPSGFWLVELVLARQAIQRADELLMRLYEAVVAGLPPLS